MSLRICKICNCEFEGKTNSVYCSKNCSKQASRLNYQNNLKEKKCIHCDMCFTGRSRQVACENCKNLPYNYEKVQVDILCKNCKKVLSTQIKNKTNNTSKKVGSVCNNCKNDLSERRSRHMKLNNPMYNPHVRVKVASTNIGVKQNLEDYLVPLNSIPKLSREQISERMKSNNPMKNPETAKKVGEALKERYKHGELVCPKGQDHWLWKGNRERCQTIRTRIYPVWVYPILERDHFTCCRCHKKGGRLEVHHIEPTFKTIVDTILNGRNIIELTNDEFEQVIIEVIEAHKFAIGITYCRKCHLEVEHEN